MASEFGDVTKSESGPKVEMLTKGALLAVAVFLSSGVAYAQDVQCYTGKMIDRGYVEGSMVVSVQVDGTKKKEVFEPTTSLNAVEWESLDPIKICTTEIDGIYSLDNPSRPLYEIVHARRLRDTH